MTAARWLTVVSLLAALAMGCATGRRAGVGALRVECNVPDATLWLDDGLLGRVAAFSEPRPVPAGFHRLEIRHPDHFTFYAEVTLREGEGTVVRAELRRLLE